MKLETKINIIKQAIADWGISHKNCHLNYTDKCFPKYFYRKHGLNFYQATFIKNNFQELHLSILKITGYNTFMGDLSVGAGFGDDPKYRKYKLEVLEETLRLLEHKKNTEKDLLENSVKIKTSAELTSTNWNNIFERYTLNKICNSNLKYKETKEERNINVEDVISLNMLDLLKSEGFVFDKRIATNKAMNCYIKIKAKNIYFVNKSLMIRNYYPLNIAKNYIPIRFKDEQILNYLYLAGIRIKQK